MKNYTYPWPVSGDCDMGCPFYIEGLLGKKGLKPGEHCRFGVLKNVEPHCAAEERLKDED